MIIVLVEIEGRPGWDRVQVLQELMRMSVFRSRVLDVQTTFAVREPGRDDPCVS